MKKIFILSILLIFSFALYALNIKEKIARTQETTLPFDCTKTAPWGKTIYNLSGSELGSLPLHTKPEHPNCVSIKLFYYQKVDGTDNYIEIVQNISRNFKEMKLMRDKVVNKTYCESFSVEKPVTMNK